MCALTPLSFFFNFSFFFFNDTATTEIYTLSLHDALPICTTVSAGTLRVNNTTGSGTGSGDLEVFSGATLDRKSTRLNSSHVKISYAVFCLKKKKKQTKKNDEIIKKLQLTQR